MITTARSSHTFPTPTYHIIVNPVSGHQQAPNFVSTEIIPLLDHLGIPYKIHHTSGVRDAGRIGREIWTSCSSEASGELKLNNVAKGKEGQGGGGSSDHRDTFKVIIAGGDGTAHEMIEGILESHAQSSLTSPFSSSPSSSSKLGRWELIVLPLGTANALYSSLFPPSYVVQASTIPTQIAEYFESNSTSSETILKLSSLISALSASSSSSSTTTTTTTNATNPRRLPITLTSLLPHAEPTLSDSNPNPNPDPEPILHPIPSHIVLSTSLHASLLATSESLRSTHPGLERFKLAAESNLGVFFRADLKLYPHPPSTDGRSGTDEGSVKQYQPSSQSWVQPFTNDDRNHDHDHDHDLDVNSGGEAEDTLTKTITLKGPFTYMLSSTTTPRLEPSFVISPLLQTLPPNPADKPTMDLTIMRPLRDPRVRAARASASSTVNLFTAGNGDKRVNQAGNSATIPDIETEIGSEEWKLRAREVLGCAYQEGKHVDLTYPVDGGGGVGGDGGDGSAEIRGKGDVVVETFRCAGFEWIPQDPHQEPSHIVCADGSIYAIPRGGKAVVGIMETDDELENGGRHGQGNGNELYRPGFWVWA